VETVCFSLSAANVQSDQVSVDELNAVLERTPFLMRAQLRDDRLQSVERRAGGAHATVLRDKHEVVTKRVSAVIELVDAHHAAQYTE
jgi:cobalamin-dependent methionine synthase I